MQQIHPEIAAEISVESYNQMQMQLSSGAHIPDGLLAAMTLLNEKPRLGVPSCNPASHPGHDVCQSTAALGLSWNVASETRQSVVTGRFLSPDPSGIAFSNPSNPQSWNLYSYVMNNPLGSIDPDGRECVWSNGSFDSQDDPDTGSSGGCHAAGGVYYDPRTFTAGGGQDWSSAPNAELAQQYSGAESLAASLPQSPDPSQATWGNTSTTGSTTTINFGGPNWDVTQVGTGTHPFRDNNPGDIESGSFTSANGALGEDGRFAVFPTSSTGSKALDSLLHGGGYINLSINQAVARYAPAFENNVAGYQQFLLNVVGVSGNTPLSSLSTAQFSALENGIARYEGFNAAGGYSVTTTSAIMVP